MKNRILKVKEKIKDTNDAVLVSSIPNIIYLTGFSGFSKDEREAYLLITKDKEYLLTDGRYIEAVKKIPNFKIIETPPTVSLYESTKELIKKNRITKVAIEENNLTILEHKRLFEHSNDSDHCIVSAIRLIKDSDEIKNIKEACKLADRAIKHIISKIKIGITEKELASTIEFFIRKQGSDISFKPVVAFAQNSAIPHHEASDRKLKKGEIVLVDLGAKINNYCSDITRVFFMGKATNEQKIIYETALSAQKKSIEDLYNKLVYYTCEIPAKDIDLIARKYIISKGFPSIPHGLGHGVGIEIHESPRLSPKSADILKPGMVFTIEPGIYLKEVGGVRIEDVIALTEKGVEILTTFPKELIELY